jgi:putative acetyltransferase
VTIELTRLTAPTADAAALVAELSAELSGEGYDPSQQHGLSLNKLFAPGIHFYVAYNGDAPAGCGGIQFFPGFAELKRMYVRPEFRGAGVASAIIAQLERDAATTGARTVRLETGDKQAAAMRFYTREGYRVCAAFPPYTEMNAHAIATSVFMEKALG